MAKKEKNKLPAAVELGKLGGRARKAALSARERSVIALSGAKARWGRLVQKEKGGGITK